MKRSDSGLLVVDEGLNIKGHGIVEMWNEDGELIHYDEFDNLVTQVGDTYYGARAAGLGSPPAQVTGMQLGTSAAAVAKTGAGAGINSLAAASLVAIDGTWPQGAIQGNGYRIQWKTTWAAGVATVNGIQEVALVNQSTATQTVAPVSATIARAILTTVVNKGASDTLAITWNHDLLGA